MNVDEIVPAALKLPPRDRALLAASLWESLEDPYLWAAGESSEDESIALAEKRDEELESGTVQPLSHTELMRRLRR